MVDVKDSNDNISITKDENDTISIISDKNDIISIISDRNDTGITKGSTAIDNSNIATINSNRKSSSIMVISSSAVFWLQTSL